MKLILERWKNHLKENEAPYKIYCDMDGVLVDFVVGVLPLINRDIADTSIPDRKPTGGMSRMGKLRRKMEELGISEITMGHISKGKEKMRPAISYMISVVGNDMGWWANLPWMPDGRELWAFIEPHNPTILTTPMGENSEEGKRIWVENNLDISRERVIMAPNPPGKSGWAESDRILIDDFYDTNIIPWKAAGGIPVYHTSAAQTIQMLKELGF